MSTILVDAAYLGHATSLHRSNYLAEHDLLMLLADVKCREVYLSDAAL